MSAHRSIGTGSLRTADSREWSRFRPRRPGLSARAIQRFMSSSPRTFTRNDPFILLADDRIDLPSGQRAGGAHPHAGFEIVTFVVEGEMRDRDEGLLQTGDVAWTTAGSGVVHNEDVLPLGKVRILQLWVTSPSALRWAEPQFEHVKRDEVPVRREPGVEARVYSGSSGSIDAGAHLNLPLTMVDIRLAPHAAFEQALPAGYAGFLYPLEGELLVDGPTPQRLAVGQIGWLDHAESGPLTSLRLTAGRKRGASRLVCRPTARSAYCDQGAIRWRDRATI